MEQSRLSEVQLGITAAAIAGDHASLYRLVAELLDDGVPFETVLFDVLLRSERDVGLRWQAGDYLVSEEHAATASLETVIALLAGSFDRPQDGTFVVVAAAQGDTHSLPARAVAAHLLFLGYRTTFLGADILASDLGEYLESEPPDAVVLSCAMSNHLLGARASVKASHDVAVPVLVGGRAFGENGLWAPGVGADAWVAEPRDVATHLETWSPDPVAAEAGAKNPGGLLEGVIDQHNAVLAEAERRLADSIGEPVSARLRNELAIALEATEASMLVEDATLLSHFLEWQRQTLDAHGLANHTSPVEPLVGALETISPEAAAWVDQAAGRADA
ncbi:MAG: cobalamin-dependent protein [Acidimicrobiia bacterium]|jgi:MerR family transcriptional regulator, light-induced transcriptional regulator